MMGQHQIHQRSVVIELIDFQYNDEALLALIAQRLHSQSVGLIYFDIAEFSEIERTYGAAICEQILNVLKKKVTSATPALFTYRIIGDDFFLYTGLPRDRQSDVLQILQNLCKDIKRDAEQAVMDEITLFTNFTLHAGCEIIDNNQSKHLHYIVYSAMKNTIHQAKTKKSP